MSSSAKVRLAARGGTVISLPEFSTKLHRRDQFGLGDTARWRACENRVSIPCPRSVDFWESWSKCTTMTTNRPASTRHTGIGTHRSGLRLWNGDLPPRVLRLVVEWAWIHRRELLENWALRKNRVPLKRIDPLEELEDRCRRSESAHSLYWRF